METNVYRMWSDIIREDRIKTIRPFYLYREREDAYRFVHINIRGRF